MTPTTNGGAIRRKAIEAERRQRRATIEPLNYHQRGVLQAVYKACVLGTAGWAEARDIARFSHPNMVEKYGGQVVAPTLTVLRGWKKPLIESRDSGYGTKEYRLTAAGERARKDSRVSSVPH